VETETWVVPPTYARSKCSENELRIGPVTQCGYNNNAGDPKQDMADSTNALEDVQHSPEIKVAKDGKYENRPHQKGDVPGLGHIGVVVEDYQALYAVRHNDKRGEYGENPSGNRDPACNMG